MVDINNIRNDVDSSNSGYTSRVRQTRNLGSSGGGGYNPAPVNVNGGSSGASSSFKKGLIGGVASVAGLLFGAYLMAGAPTSLAANNAGVQATNVPAPVLTQKAGKTCLESLCSGVRKVCPINQRVGSEVTVNYAYRDNDFGTVGTGSFTGDSYVPKTSQTYTDGLRTDMLRVIKDVTSNGRNQHASVYVFPEGTTTFEPGKHIAKFPKVNFGSNNWGENTGNSKGGYNTNTLGGYIQDKLAHCENLGVIYVGDLDPNAEVHNHYTTNVTNTHNHRHVKVVKPTKVVRHNTHTTSTVVRPTREVVRHTTTVVHKPTPAPKPASCGTDCEPKTQHCWHGTEVRNGAVVCKGKPQAASKPVYTPPVDTCKIPVSKRWAGNGCKYDPKYWAKPQQTAPAPVKTTPPVYQAPVKPVQQGCTNCADALIHKPVGETVFFN